MVQIFLSLDTQLCHSLIPDGGKHPFDCNSLRETIVATASLTVRDENENKVNTVPLES